MIITLWKTILIYFFIHFVIYAKYDPINHIHDLLCDSWKNRTSLMSSYYGEIKFQPYEKKKNKSAVF